MLESRQVQPLQSFPDVGDLKEDLSVKGKTSETYIQIPPRYLVEVFRMRDALRSMIDRRHHFSFILVLEHLKHEGGIFQCLIGVSTELSVGPVCFTCSRRKFSTHWSVDLSPLTEETTCRGELNRNQSNSSEVLL